MKLLRAACDRAARVDASNSAADGQTEHEELNNFEKGNDDKYQTGGRQHMTGNTH
jgi:hypothetical protein